MTRDLGTVYVPLPNHWGARGEAIWARPLGEDLYELQSSPLYAYGLNFLDVVLATTADPSLPPQIRRVVRRSGHVTLRAIFFDGVPHEQRLAFVEGLAPHGATYEAADARYYVIDVETHGDVAAVRSALQQWEARGLLEYETCEAKQEGSFDDVAPQGDT